MAKCPNCGKKLHIYDWRPECPNCKVNLVYFNSNENLLSESEKAEIAHAKSQPSIDRAKASFFGSAPAIIRIIISLLPISALFLPLCTLNGVEGTKNINAIGIYNLVSKGFGDMINLALGGNLVYLAVLLVLVSVVMILVCLGFTVMSLGKHGKIRNLILNLVLLALPLVATILFAVADIPKCLPDYTNGKLGVGIFLYMALIILLLVYNLILAKKGLKIKHTLCLIGGLPSDEYFKMVEDGVSELEIRKKMVVALTKMQEEALAKEAQAEKEALEKAMARK